MELKLTGINWLTTYDCDYDCAHCFFDTNVDRGEYMDPDLVDKALTGFKYGQKMFWQHLSGGEIFLDTKKLLQIIKNIKKYFNGNIGISTNGSWAVSDELCDRVLDQLVALGVNGMAVSADAFHVPFSELTATQRLVNAIRRKGLNGHSYLMGARLAPALEGATAVNQKAGELAEMLNSSARLPLAPTTIRSIGKGSRMNKPKLESLPQGMCTDLCTCLGTRSPFNPAMVWIDYLGNVMICYGITIGNLHESTLNEIIEGYHNKMNPVIRSLAESGPKGLKWLAVARNKRTPPMFYDECDLCYQSRKALRDDFPEILKPAACYPD